MRRALWRVRPKIAVSGHIHDARGAERVRWDLRNKHVKYRELGVQHWEDPGIGNERNSLVDLTAKGGHPLDHEVDEVGDTASLDPGVPACRVATASPPGGPGPTAEAPAQLGIGTRGLSGDPGSARSDQAALARRLGRRETCIVNCAIQTAYYPHRGGPRVLNKPIIVDVDLPVWDHSTSDC